MIDVTLENLIELEHAGDQVKPPRDRSSMWRYCRTGIKVGHRRVKLDSVKVGGRRYTSAEAWERFIAATSSADAHTPEIPTRRERERDQTEASQRLVAAGLLSSRRKKGSRAFGGHKTPAGVR